MVESSTELMFDKIMDRCRSIFVAKLADYGTTWIAFRLSSLTDQMLIKARRIRRLEELDGEGKIDEGPADEYIGIINYALIALMKISHPQYTAVDAPEIDADLIAKDYDSEAAIVRSLMLDKNHDYGEAWRDMRISSITDQILIKLLRLKKMEDGDGPKISEPPPSHYRDIINYSIFASILLEEKEGTKN